MKTTLQNFFKVKKNKIIVSLILIFTILASAGFYLNSQAQEQKKQEQAKIEKEKAEEQAKKDQEEQEKIELAKVEEEKKKAEELEKEKQKQENNTEIIKKEKNNSSSKPKNNSSSTTKKSNNNSNNSSSKPKNNSNNNNNKFEIEDDENTYSKIGNSGKFFSTRAEALSWVKSQIANENSIYWKNGYNSYWIGQCKYNGKVGWTINFIK